MYKTFKQRVILKREDQAFLLNLMHTSKNLYNSALYNVRQHYFDTGNYLTYNENYELLKNTDNYKILNSSEAQAVIRKVDEAMKSFFGSLRAKVKKVKLPRYLDKNGYYPIIDRMVYKTDNNVYNLPRGNFIKSINNDLIIDGKTLKSYIQLYHKNMAKLSSTRPDQNKLTKNMIKEIGKRNNRMTYGINKAAKEIINHAINNNVKYIVMGYNDNFKDESLSKRYNQWTKSIPIAKLRDRIIYLASIYDIETNVINESYTSKASYLDKDSFNKDSLSGIRVKRGLYKSKNGTLINADLNAAFNILRKCKPDALWLGDRGLNTPKRTYII